MHIDATSLAVCWTALLDDNRVVGSATIFRGSVQHAPGGFDPGKTVESYNLNSCDGDHGAIELESRT